ncbi:MULTISPECIES: hypothetical protein [unclassified Pseudomonas]|uniref:hypothetical protein n=1 Tax=unclassified Pseudomonas TaxID=196821 RepID=UPI001F57B3B4|nr:MULTISPECIES: hypothetical protein [unclassified Pseudomonas]
MKRNQNRIAEIFAFSVAFAMIGYIAAKAFADQVGVDVPAGGFPARMNTEGCTQVQSWS